MTETEQAIKEYDILIKGYEDDLLSDRYSDIVKEEFKRQRDIFLIGREALKEKAGQEAAQETCPCKNDLKACCTCVSMYCYECINKSEYVMGSFCSCCGRKLK